MSQTFEKKYKINDTGSSGIIELSNGDFLFCTDYSKTLTRIDLSGNVIWEKNSNELEADIFPIRINHGAPIIETNGIVYNFGSLSTSNLCGNPSFRPAFHRFNALTPPINATSIYKEYFGPSTCFEAGGFNSACISLSQNFIAATGQAKSESGNFYNPVLYFFDLFGNFGNSYAYDFANAGTGEGSSATKIITLNDGHLLVCGLTKNTSLGDASFIMKINSFNGNVIFCRSFNTSSTSTGNIANNIYELPNGNILCLAQDNLESKLFLFDPGGTPISCLLFDSQISSAIKLNLQSVQVASDGTFFLCGGVNSTITGSLGSFIINFDPITQDIIWSNVYPRCHSSGSNDLLITSDNFLIFQSESFDDSFPVLLKMDMLGQGNICFAPLLLKLKNYPILSSDITNDIIKTDINTGKAIFDPLVQNIEVLDNCCSSPLSIFGNTQMCMGTSQVIGASPGFTYYYWSTGEITQNITITNPGLYEVWAVDANGCTGYTSINISFYPETVPAVTGPDNLCCSNLCFDVTNSSDFTNYFWTSSPPLTIIGQGTSSICLSGVNTSLPAALNLQTTDVNGCISNTITELIPCCTISDPVTPLYTDACQPSAISDYLSVWPFSGTTLSNQSIVIEEDLTIDQSVNFIACTIYVAQGKQILVDPSISLTFDQCFVREKCNAMWKGIYISDPGSSLIATKTTFREAEEALVSSNSGILNLTDCIFTSNYIGAKIQFHSGGMAPVTVQNCQFTTGIPLLPPYSGYVQGFKGIEIFSVSEITIGVSNTPSNTFELLDFGIHSDNSSLTVVNSIFQDIKDVGNPSCLSCQCDLGTGVCAIITKNFPNKYFTIGSINPADKNIFRRNFFGTTAIGKFKTDIAGNDFNGHQGAVSVYNAPGQFININNNLFKNFIIGAGVYEIPKADLKIQNNDFNTGFTHLPNVSNTAIYVNHALISTFTADVSNNTIKKVRNGIYFIKASGLTSLSNPPIIKIHDNSITFNQLGSNATMGNNHVGIRMEDCVFAEINLNSVLKPGAAVPDDNTAQLIDGIRINNSKVMLVDNNYLKTLGYGINVKGSCFPSLLKCNEMERCYNGVNFDFSTIGNQLNGSIPTGNEWTGPGALHSVNFDLAGSLSTPIDWYYNSNNGGDFVPINGMPSLNFLSSAPVDVAIADQCGNPAMLTPPQEREKRLGKIVRNENIFTTNATEHRLNEMLYAYTELEKNNAWLNLGTTDDTTYQNFYTNCQNNCVGNFTKTYLNIEDENFLTAQTYNSSVTINNDWEYYQKRVNEIYLNSKVDSLPISLADSIELYDIAYLHSAYYGPGVFSARAILKLEVEDLQNGTTRSSFIQNNEENIVSRNFEIYPNPSTGTFVIHSEDPQDSYVISISDIIGKVILEMPLTSGNTMEINLKIPNGTYLVHVRNKDELIEVIKLVITK